jgi:hypothetical protein
MAEAKSPMTPRGGDGAMSRSGQKLIQAAREALAMARGEEVPGAVLHQAPTRALPSDPHLQGSSGPAPTRTREDA